MKEVLRAIRIGCLFGVLCCAALMLLGKVAGLSEPSGLTFTYIGCGLGYLLSALIADWLEGGLA